MDDNERQVFQEEYPYRFFPYFYDKDGKLLPWDHHEKNQGLGWFAHCRLWLKMERQRQAVEHALREFLRLLPHRY